MERGREEDETHASHHESSPPAFTTQAFLSRPDAFRGIIVQPLANSFSIQLH